MKHEVVTNARNRQRFAGFLADVSREPLSLACIESHDDKLIQFGRLLRSSPDLSVKRCSELIRGLRMAEVSEAYQTYQKAHGLAKLAEALPQMMADMADNALNRDVVCPRCEGAGKAMVGQTVRECLHCGGVGTIVQPGDPRSRDQIMNALRMGEQRAPLVAQQFLMSGGEFSVENLIKQSSRLIGGPDKK